MQVLVATVVHDPRDARIYAREITSLVEAGHDVTYIAPFAHFGLSTLPGVQAVDIPASHGRHRLAGIRGVRRELRRRADDHDLVLIHCPEILLGAWDLKHPCIVWDVHEDTAAAVTLKTWLPEFLRRPVAVATRKAESWAERHWRLVLAEDSYAERFLRSHPVVPNSTPVPDEVPPPGDNRVVYVGDITRARGAQVLVDVARLRAARPADSVHPDVTVHLIGRCSEEMKPIVQAAHERGDLVWHGYLPNAEALALIRGATAGLSLLRDEPNYRHSKPTKIMEYFAQGLPVITTPLPLARAMIEDSGGGIVVPFDDAAAVVSAIDELVDDAQRRIAMAQSGREWVRANADWNRDGPRFVSVLEGWAATS